MACVIGSRLLDKLLLILNIADQVCWTNSMIALYWIKGSPKRLTLFIRNRVKKVLELTDASSWHHCPGKENPADQGNCSISTEKLNQKLWFSGPQ